MLPPAKTNYPATSSGVVNPLRNKSASIKKFSELLSFHGFSDDLSAKSVMCAHQRKSVAKNDLSSLSETQIDCLGIANLFHNSQNSFSQHIYNKLDFMLLNGKGWSEHDKVAGNAVGAA